MNMYIQQIMRALTVSAYTATEVYDNMQIDCSECSAREFNEHAKFVYEAIRTQEIEEVV